MSGNWDEPQGNAAATRKGRRAARGSARTPTFVAEKSDTKFALTPEEEAHLNNLLVWQEQSAKSVMMIGGTGEAPNVELNDRRNQSES